MASTRIVDRDRRPAHRTSELDSHLPILVFWANAALAIRRLAGGAGASGTSAAIGAAALAGIHALTCALPLGITAFFLGQKEELKKMPPMAMPHLRLPPMPKLQLPALGDGRVTPPLMRQV